MANIKSQIKRNRQNDKKRLRNRIYRGEARIAVKNARTTIDAGVPESKAALLEAISSLDKAAEQGVIHKNNAARRKSRLVKAFTKMVPAQVTVELATKEPILEMEPAAKKKASPRRTTTQKAEEPKVEPKAELKPSSLKGKKSPAKKQAVKKVEPKKPAEKKAASGKTSPKGKKPTAKK